MRKALTDNVNTPDGAPDFLRLNSDMVECLTIAIAFVAILVVPFVIPFKAGRPFSQTAMDVDDLLQVIPMLVVPNLLHHFCLYFIHGAKVAARLRTALCLLPAVLAALLICLLQLAHMKLELKRDATTLESLIFVAACLAILISLCLSIARCFFAVPVALVWMALALLATHHLSIKGYQFSFRDRGRLAREMGLSTLKALPPREELALLPGYGNGTVNEILRISDEVQLHLSRAEERASGHRSAT